MNKCNYNYKGNTYTEEDIKPIASYHYMLQDKLLQTGDFEEVGNTIVAKQDEVIFIPKNLEKIDFKITFVPNTTIVNSTDPIALKKEQDLLKKKYEQLLNLARCIGV